MKVTLAKLAMRRGSAVVLILMCCCRGAGADPETCNAATEQYRSVLDEVSEALSAYATCIYDTQGDDDCSSEFAALQSAQEHFELAVALRESECQ